MEILYTHKEFIAPSYVKIVTTVVTLGRLEIQ